MLFRDEAVIFVKGGDGGGGTVSFYREANNPWGGPDGGDGGKGGDVWLVASHHLSTLGELGGKVHFRAGSGEPGRSKKCAGKDAEDLVLEVPVGTQVHERDSALLLRDLAADGDRVLVAAGGKGGLGNPHFARATHRTPREATPGERGETRWLRLELKLLADVGLLGLPNAGKSTLLSRLSSAHPKVADYPFTTLEPVLGVVPLPDYRRFVIADLPGLIEGAHKGVGLGDRFLKHVERTRVLLHLVDAAPPEGTPRPVAAYRIVRKELAAYSAELAGRPEVVAATKMDIPEAKRGLQQLRRALGRDRPVIAVSAVTGAGLADLVAELLRHLPARTA
ncbi:MAG: GTPase ObgE [Planctomycetales bacterium]|nr:GTPase ObgE [Planctomycetales bacterium]